jgi:hypothetical protein
MTFLFATVIPIVKFAFAAGQSTSIMLLGAAALFGVWKLGDLMIRYSSRLGRYFARRFVRGPDQLERVDAIGE